MKPKVLDGLVLAYGLLLIVLGLIGYFRGGSVYSLSGVAAGILVLGFLAITAKKRQVGRIGVAVISLLLLGRFGMSAVKSMSAGPTTTAAATQPGYQVWTIAVASLVVFLSLGVGHMMAMKERKLE